MDRVSWETELLLDCFTSGCAIDQLSNLSLSCLSSKSFSVRPLFFLCSKVCLLLCIYTISSSSWIFLFHGLQTGHTSSRWTVPKVGVSLNNCGLHYWSLSFMYSYQWTQRGVCLTHIWNSAEKVKLLCYRLPKKWICTVRMLEVTIHKKELSSPCPIWLIMLTELLLNVVFFLQVAFTFRGLLWSYFFENSTRHAAD